MRSAAYCRAQLKAAQADRKAANTAVRYWLNELRAAHLLEGDREAAREAGVDPPPPLPPARCECPKVFSTTDGTCDSCGCEVCELVLSRDGGEE